MLEMNYELARDQMVNRQVREWDVLNRKVCEVMGRLARERFTPERYRTLAYADTEVPIGHGEIMLRPSVQARMLQAAEIRAGDRVLEVGTGTGYLTACLTALGGTVRSVDIHEDLVEAARHGLAEEACGEAEFGVEDAHRLRDEGPAYEAILVTGSLPSRDPSFARRLVVGGRLVWIIGAAPAMRVELLTRAGEEDWRTEGLFETVVPVLKGAERPRRFEF